MESLTVEDLSVILQDAVAAGQGEMKVQVSYNSSDHWNTAVARDASFADVKNVERSDYHRMDKLTDDEGETVTDDSKEVFIIS